MDPLEKYRAKRSADRTTEPFGAGRASPRLFVVQKHHARRLHFDFRLELEGTLKSWAVPQGPSLDPAVKRLAVHVEDHPVEYADFEGIIPEGNYGAGAVIVWDRGRWTPLEDPVEGLAKGKLLFSLDGYKLRGVWTLVRTKRQRGDARAPEEWLLIKKPDAFAAPEGQRPLGQESILSGLSVDELRAAGEAKAAEVRARLIELRAPRRAVDPEAVELMLAETADEPFSRAGWLFELKYDGYRVIAARKKGQPRLIYRRGSDATVTFPELARALRALPYEVVLDGEVCVLDGEGKPWFHGLQQRGMLSRPSDVERQAVELPATLYVFDLLAFEDFDLRPLPLKERKAILKSILPRTGPLRFADDVDERGKELYQAIRARGLEGMVAKRADSAYRGGRSRDWLKVRIERTGDFVVVGYVESKRASRSGFSGLYVAASRGDGLHYVGRVGGGFSEAELVETRARLDRARRATPPCDGPIPRERGQVWCEPQLVVEVRYTDITHDGHLREPSFLRFRDDKRIDECHFEFTPREEAVPPAPSPPAPVERKVPFSNLDKVFWPEEKYTKGDLIDYYKAIAPQLLPYLKDRPIVLTRFPDGIGGKSFFQKDAPGFIPGWMRTERIWSEDTARDIDYFICEDVESLLYIINMAAIPLHVWASRVGSLERPDWCILDLDPKGAPFTDVVAIANEVHALCGEIALPSYIKTSGATGLHVLIPLGGACTFAQAKALGQVLARVVADRRPDIATVARSVGARGGKVYVDFLQNGHGKTIAGPYSARPVPGATVSAPLAWSEVSAKLDPKRFTIETMPARAAKLDEDPLRPVLTEAPDILAALGRLAALVAR